MSAASRSFREPRRAREVEPVHRSAVQRRAHSSAFVRRLRAHLALAALVLTTLAPVDSPSSGQEPPAPIPRGATAPSEAIDAVRRHAIEASDRQRAAVDGLRSAVRKDTDRRLGLADRPASDHRPLRRLLYFTSRTCAVCDASLDDLVHAVFDRHPDVAPEVIYLGNPLLEYPEAASVFVSFADDVIARWRERLHDPAVITALACAGKVNDTSGRVHVSFATHEAESRGITEVPAFVLTGPTAERVALGRPENTAALEAALMLTEPEVTP